jgi:hypothetical protein
MDLKVFFPIVQLSATACYARGKWFQNLLCITSFVDNSVDAVCKITVLERQLNKNQDQHNHLYEIFIDKGIPVRITFGPKQVPAWIVYYEPLKSGSLQFYSIRPLILDLQKEEEDPEPQAIFNSTSSLHTIPDDNSLDECLQYVSRFLT